MPKLRQLFLEGIRTVGNHSGCHQLPDRSFFINGKQFPVCARCTGVFIGQTLSILCLPFRINIKSSSAILCLSIMGIDWSLQEFGIKQSTNIRRFFTGILGGLGVFALYINFIRYFAGILFSKFTNAN